MNASSTIDVEAFEAAARGGGKRLLTKSHGVAETPAAQLLPVLTARVSMRVE